MNKFHASIFFTSTLIAGALYAGEIQCNKVSLAQVFTNNTDDTLEFFVGVGAFNICFNLDPLNQHKCQPQCEALWNILTPDEIMDILSWCTIGWYNQTYQALYAPHIIERQKFIDLAQKVESAGIYIEDLNLVVDIDPKEPNHAHGLQIMFQQMFDNMKYHLIYTSLCSQCTSDEALILHSLCTPTQFKMRMSIMLEGIVEPVLFPDYYSPETIYDDMTVISESLTQFVESLTSQQKLFLLLESNLRSNFNTLETIHTKHQAALDALKIKPGAIVLMRTQEFYAQVPENIHTGVPKEDLVLVIPFEALYEKAQKIVETSGTPLQKALFKLQAKPQNFVNFNKELK